MDWQNKTKLIVDGAEYELVIEKNVKFCHFNRYISGITYHKEDIVKELHTRDNFCNKSGKWDSKDWDEFENFMDDHFKPEFSWREHCDWAKNFINTDRSYFTMSLGYEVHVLIPYAKFKAIDSRESDIDKVSTYINKIAGALGFLLE